MASKKPMMALIGIAHLSVNQRRNQLFNRCQPYEAPYGIRSALSSRSHFPSPS